MTLHYASTFADALAKLNHQEQKQVKITTVDLMMDPKGAGLSLERLKHGADDKLWSARVSRDLRIIMRRDGDDLLLAYVGHHDDAYNWAKRRKIIPHERTGAMQIVELVEQRVEPGEAYHSLSLSKHPAISAKLTLPSWHPRDDQLTPPSRLLSDDQLTLPFCSLSDDQLLDVGVPRDWLQAVRETNETEIDALFDHLPAEAAEALYDFATGGKLEDHIAEQAPPGTDPFAHPDAMRRFRTVEGLEELKAALDAPFEKWAIFLHPAQRQSVERDWGGPARVSGSAGTGKTIVALHRAVRLAEPDRSNILLTTFSDRLAENLSTKVRLLTESRPDLRKRIHVRSIDEAARELYKDICGEPNLSNAAQTRSAIEAAKQSGLGDQHSIEFLIEEWDEVIDAWGLNDLDEYYEVPRIGRKARLGSRQRAAAWEVFDFVRQWLRQRNLITKSDLYGKLAAALTGGMEFPYTHVVVDEAQDLSVSQVRFLAAAGARNNDSLFLSGDLGQRIFRLPFSWLKLGLDIRGRSQALKVCYRTSHQIRAMADRLLASEISDQDGFIESRKGTVSVFDGPDPEIRIFANQRDEIAAVSKWLESRIAEGVEPDQIAVIVRSEAELGRARASISGIEDRVTAILMHEAKGLEFRSCVVMAVDEDVLPDATRLQEVGDIADLEAIQDAERHLLYVACTRARDHLFISAVEPGSEFLDDIVVN